MDKDYYAINSRGMAEAIRFLSGQNYYVNDHKYLPDRKVYTFEDTKLFRDVLTHVTTYSKHFQNKKY